MADLFAPVCSIAPTRRRRFFWAAWWSAPPTPDPFRKPDASGGGARSRADALHEAEAAAGRPLVEVDARWARAWSRVVTGEAPWTRAEIDRDAAGADHHARPRAARPQPTSIWTTLGVPATATRAEIKAAFRKRALETHPDHGGESLAFRTLRAAYAEACKRRERPRKRR
jgi:hypothetical protein